MNQIEVETTLFYRAMDIVTEAVYEGVDSRLWDYFTDGENNPCLRVLHVVTSSL
jgi:hypothetical protein